MKFTFNGYEIDLKVKKEWKNKATKKDALQFINELVILYDESAQLAKIESQTNENGELYNAYAELQNKRSKVLFEICENGGLYDNLK